MTCFRFDGSYGGFLSAVFEAYRIGTPQPRFVHGQVQAPNLFGSDLPVSTVGRHAARVERGLHRHGGAEVALRIHHAFLSEVPGIADTLWGYLRVLFAEGVEAADNPLQPYGPAVRAAARRTHRETHRMHAFVRFTEQADGTWGATIEPECHVLPLIGAHFRERFDSMRWVIVDARRHLGLFHEEGTLRMARAERFAEAHHANEQAWQHLWRAYYEAVNIPERENLRLRQRHIPKRYWAHLSELHPPVQTRSGSASEAETTAGASVVG